MKKLNSSTCQFDADRPSHCDKGVVRRYSQWIYQRSRVVFFATAFVN